MRSKSRTSSPRSSISALTTRPSGAQLLLEQFLCERRIGLAAGRLHHLTREETQHIGFAGFVVGDDLGVGRQHFVDDGLDRAAVAYLRQAFALDDRFRRAAL